MAAIAGRRGPIMVLAVLMMMATLLLGFITGAGAWQSVGGSRCIRSPLWRRGPSRWLGPGPWHGGRRLAAADIGAAAADGEGEVGACV